MNTQKIILSIGISGSGKSTWACNFVQQNPNYYNLNRDDIRTSLCGSREIWTQGREFEELVTKIQVAAGKEILKTGKSLIISDTNLSLKTQRLWQTIATDAGVEFEINDSFLSVPLEVCLERDAQRAHQVGQAVIKRQFEAARKLKRLEPVKKIEPIVQNAAYPKCVAFDLDGTLCLMEKHDTSKPHYRNPYDASKCENDLLNENVAKLLNLYRKAGYFIFLVSGREDKYRPHTVRWLEKHGINWDFLYMRKSADFRKDADIKEEIYRTNICSAYYVEAIIDDRLQVCKRLYQLGLPVFRVGDPEADF